MHRLQISLPRAQLRFLQDRARREGISAAEVIRRLLEREAQAVPVITQADIDAALSFAGIGEDKLPLIEGKAVSEYLDLYLADSDEAGAEFASQRVVRDKLAPSGAALRATERLLASLSRAEKAQVLQWVARDLGDAFPGIESTPGVYGGEPCIVRTRIPVWLLVRARELGTGEGDLLHAYPTLRAEDLINAWAYARAHRSEIQAQITAHEMA